MEELRASAKPHRLSYRDMDLLEYAVYGDVHRYNHEAGVAMTHQHNFDK